MISTEIQNDPQERPCSCLHLASISPIFRLTLSQQLLISISFVPHRVSSSAMSLLIELHHRFSQKLKSRAEELRGGPLYSSIDFH